MLKVVAWGMGFYPIIAHLGLWFFSARLAAFYLLTLLLVILLYPPRFKQPKNIALVLSLLLATLFLAINQMDKWLIYLPPIFIPSLLFVLFVRSLGQGNEPLITKFARSIEVNGFSKEREVYTRHVTQLWTGVFAFMTMEAITLGLIAPLEVWSLATHIGNYVLIVLVITVEFIYRRYKFKSESDHFINFVKALIRHRWN